MTDTSDKGKEKDMPDFNEIMGLLAKADEELGKLREENSELREYMLDAMDRAARHYTWSLLWFTAFLATLFVALR